MSRYRYLGAAAIVTVAQWLVILASSPPAHAQTAAPSPAASPASGGELQQVTVTSYLIPRVGDGPQPITTYGQDYIDKTGSQTISDVLQNLPGAVNNWSPSYTAGFGFSPGSASVALKGLPPNDTLTLVDGLRYPQYPFPQVSTAAITSFVDLNSIPMGAIDRIEMLNDGGSATYGTDAVAGVVNVVLKDQYDGAEIYKAGYDKDGKKLVGEKAIAPPPEGSHWSIRDLIANTTLNFGINNVFDTRPPYSADWYQSYDPSNANYIRRYFWMSIDKKF